ncbi:MAG: TolC family protein [Thiohalomonadaceae bacterium]
MNDSMAPDTHRRKKLTNLLRPRRSRVFSMALGVVLVSVPLLGAAQETPLTLEHLIQRALEENPQLGVARATSDAAGFRLEQSRASYYPRLSLDTRLEQATLNANSPRETLPFLDFGGTQVPVVNPEEDMSGFRRTFVSLSAEYLLYDFGRRASTVKIGEENLGSAQASLAKSINETILAVSAAYFGALRAQELAEVERQSLKRQQEALRISKTLHAAGRGTASDIARAEADLARAELSLVQAKNEVGLSQLALRRAVGLSPDGEPLRLAKTSRLKEPSGLDKGVQELIEHALELRPELAAQQRIIAVSSATVAKERAEYFPVLNLFGNYNVQQYEDVDSSPNYTVGVQMSWQIYDGALRRNRVGEAKARLVQEQDRLRDATLGVATDVRDAYQRFLEAKEQLQVTAKVIKASELDLKLARKGYKEGIRMIYDLSTADTNYRNAKAQGVMAEYNLQNAIAKLYWALGSIANVVHK